MYALIETGGKQYQVSKDQKLNIERLEVEAGKEIAIDKVLMVSDGKKVKLGKPCLKDHIVKLKVIEHTRGEKIIVFKKKRRKDYKRKHGHKQDLSRVEVLDIIEPNQTQKSNIVDTKQKTLKSDVVTTNKETTKSAGVAATKKVVKSGAVETPKNKTTKPDAC